MAQQTQTRRTRQAAPERWEKAAQRAIAEHIDVRQVNANGMWTATSGSDPKVAYVLEIVAGVVRSCSCPAGEFGDPCCKHAARYSLDAGLLGPGAGAPGSGRPGRCFRCRGTEAGCPVCAGAGSPRSTRRRRRYGRGRPARRLTFTRRSAGLRRHAGPGQLPASRPGSP